MQFKNLLKKLWKDESAQGATEYILLLAVVAGLVLLFKKEIVDTARSMIQNVKGQMNDAVSP